jgi:hypothetical protein
MRVTWVQDEVDHVIAFLAAPPIARRLNASPVHLDGFTLAFRATSQGTTSRSQLGTSRSRLAGRCRCMRLLCRHLPLPRDLTVEGSVSSRLFLLRLLQCPDRTRLRVGAMRARCNIRHLLRGTAGLSRTGRSRRRRSVRINIALLHQSLSLQCHGSLLRRLACRVLLAPRILKSFVCFP